MTQRDMAGYLGVDVKTIRNWRKNKPNLYEIIIKGFTFDKVLDNAKNNYEELQKLNKSCCNKNNMK